ncbi:aconitase X swivel domain-containing protein [Geodermatophilus sp. SYSU D00965]
MTDLARGREQVVLRGRGLVGGVAEGEALVTREAISGWGGVEPRQGRVIESRHELVGQSFAGKVLVFPTAKGSSGWSGMFHMARLMGSAPAAMVFTTMNTKIALGVVVSHVPAVTDLDGDPFTAVRTGDRVRVDADRGEVTVTPRGR